MLFEIIRQARSPVPASSSRVAAGRPRRKANLGSWKQYVSRRVAIVGALAAVALVIVTALPAWAAIEDGGSQKPSISISSSVGTTGTATTRVEDLGVATFLGEIPFVRQSRYLNAVGDGAEGLRFVNGQHQANVAEYLRQVGIQVTLPFANNARTTKEALDIWRWTTTARAAEEAQAATFQTQVRGESGQALWLGDTAPSGTVLPTTITFYSCINSGFCGAMANGQQVFEGAAACSFNLPFGTQFVVNADPTGRVFTCLDRGALAANWVDIWFYDPADCWAWQSLVGTYGEITILN